MTDPVKKTPHAWRSNGYNTWCALCPAEEYETQTEFCEDLPAEKQEKIDKAARQHVATEEAIATARLALTEEQWTLLGLNRLCPYRDRDVIRV